jgi:hypothetical protein
VLVKKENWDPKLLPNLKKAAMVPFQASKINSESHSHNILAGTGQLQSSGWILGEA